jgi:hypothetical protein
MDELIGVDHVTSFYADGVEKNAVWFNPNEISISEMEQALKDAGVYLGTDVVVD